MIKNGLVHVYYGDGQGKTSAAVGLAVRACGSGCKVLYVQFLKNCRSSELKALGMLAEGIEVLTPKPCMKFFFQMSEQEKQQTAEEQNACFQTAVDKARSGQYHMLVLDEAMDAVNLGLIDREDFLGFLRNRPASLEIAITGHTMLDGLPELADYISKISKEKHPYDRGIKARVGVDL